MVEKVKVNMLMKSESEQRTLNIIATIKSESEHHREWVGMRMKATLHGLESESEHHDEVRK